MTTTLQCACSPIAMTTLHFVVWYNDPLPLTNNSILSAKILQITLELLSLVCWALLHWSPQVAAKQFVSKQCYVVHFNSMHPPNCQNRIITFCEANQHPTATKSTPEPSQCRCKQFRCCKSIETMCKDVPNVEYLHCNNNISLHEFWSFADHILLVLEAPNLPQSNLLVPSYYNPPNLR